MSPLNCLSILENASSDKLYQCGWIEEFANG